LTATGDPERQRDQFQVEPEARALQVQAIETELAGARDVARRVDLREAGEARTNAVALVIAGELAERHERPSAARVDLARTQRAGPDEAHVPDENVPELRQFVHRGRAQDAAEVRGTRIARSRLDRAGSRLRVRHHRP